MDATLKSGSLASQARRALERMISEMDLATSNKLPREEELAARLGVSRTTVRQALNDLAADGLVLRRQGRGTFVNVESMGVRARFSPASELTDAIRRCGHEPGVRLVSAYEACGDAAARVRSELRLGAEEPVLEVVKLFLADGQPCAVCRDWLGLSATGFTETDEALADVSGYAGSLYRYLFERGGRRMSWDRAEIAMATSAEVRELAGDEASAEVGERPYLLVRSVVYDTADAPAIMAEEYVDTSVVAFDLVRRVDVEY